MDGFEKWRNLLPILFIDLQCSGRDSSQQSLEYRAREGLASDNCAQYKFLCKYPPNDCTSIHLICHIRINVLCCDCHVLHTGKSINKWILQHNHSLTQAHTFSFVLIYSLSQPLSLQSTWKISVKFALAKIPTSFVLWRTLASFPTNAPSQFSTASTSPRWTWSPARRMRQTSGLPDSRVCSLGKARKVGHCEAQFGPDFIAII